jgi:hypothetical protein
VRRNLAAIAATLAVGALGFGAAGALGNSTGNGNPSTTGPPSQTCLSPQSPNEPGQASSSPGSPFNEPTGTNTGGTGGANYSPSSQYDVACYQVSNHP